MFLLYILMLYYLNTDCKYYSCDNDYVIKYYNFMLESAINNNNIEALKFLTEWENITPFYKFGINEIILDIAFEKKNIDIIKLLLFRIKDINEYVKSPLDETILEYLSYYKDYLGEKDYEDLKKIVKDKGGKPLYELNKKLYDAILKDDKTQIDLLLKEGANITDAFNTNIDENINNFKLFKKYGLDYNKLFPFVTDFKKDKWYLDEIINKNNINQLLPSTTPLISSIIRNDINLFIYLIEKGANVNFKIFNEYFHPFMNFKISPLRISIIKNKIDFAEVLLQKDAVVENIDIMLTIRSKKNKEFIKLFIKYGIGFKFTDYSILNDYYSEEYRPYKTTPLIMAIDCEQFEVAKIIADKTYLNFVDKESKTALDYAKKHKNKDLIKYLVKIGAKRGCEMRNEKCE